MSHKNTTIPYSSIIVCYKNIHNNIIQNDTAIKERPEVPFITNKVYLRLGYW